MSKTVKIPAQVKGQMEPVVFDLQDYSAARRVTAHAYGVTLVPVCRAAVDEAIEQGVAYGVHDGDRVEVAGYVFTAHSQPGKGFLGVSWVGRAEPEEPTEPEWVKAFVYQDHLKTCWYAYLPTCHDDLDAQGSIQASVFEDRADAVRHLLAAVKVAASRPKHDGTDMLDFEDRQDDEVAALVAEWNLPS